MRVTLLLAMLALGSSQTPVPGPPSTASSFVSDPESYDIYAKVLSTIDRPNELLLQQETEPLPTDACDRAITTDDPEWKIVLSNFRRENAEVRLLRPFTINRPFHFVSRAAIEADDARLALKYPGTWQRRPESIDYAAVSAVGFDWSRTKAIVYVRTRSQGDLLPMTFRDNEWVRADVNACGWIV